MNITHPSPTLADRPARKPRRAFRSKPRARTTPAAAVDPIAYAAALEVLG